MAHKSRRVGIFAGTFDPVHNGHIAFAQAALHDCALDTIVFLPEARPRHKPWASPLVHRVAMLQLACAGWPQFEVRVCDEPQFSVAITLGALQREYGRDLTLLLGSDTAANVVKWPHADRLFSEVEFAIGRRNGVIVGIPGRATYITTQFEGMSATRVRADHSEAINPQVQQYIRNHNLYYND
ncbi:MAG TPA: nicotinate-nicotinamide nucleotide adenylyltransferase [Candidatus Saccharimonadales bacterium]|nr:nicotinate-nicotinamide nucleotide adenylyltransferase [Candidatus Saccharimonadales bacterium]